MTEEEILHELLCDGARALLDAAILEVYECGARDAFHVDAVMLVESPVLYGDDGMDEVRRQLGERHVVVSGHASIDGASQEDEAAEAV